MITVVNSMLMYISMMVRADGGMICLSATSLNITELQVMFGELMMLM
jgi:hypothetical protein